MSVLNGKLTPAGVLEPGKTTTGASANSVNVGREYAMLEISVLSSGGTSTVRAERRGELFANGREPDTGFFVSVTDQNNPAAGIALTAGVGCTLRIQYPHGEYQLGVTANTGATVIATYSLTGETR